MGCGNSCGQGAGGPAGCGCSCGQGAGGLVDFGCSCENQDPDPRSLKSNTGRCAEAAVAACNSPAPGPPATAWAEGASPAVDRYGSTPAAAVGAGGGAPVATDACRVTPAAVEAGGCGGAAVDVGGGGAAPAAVGACAASTGLGPENDSSSLQGRLARVVCPHPCSTTCCGCSCALWVSPTTCCGCSSPGCSGSRPMLESRLERLEVSLKSTPGQGKGRHGEADYEWGQAGGRCTKMAGRESTRPHEV